jgi:hypothetical protein
MSYLNDKKRAISKELIKAYYRFPRREQLDKQLENVVTQYFAKLDIGKPFDARGLIVTGESRSGKTKEITSAIDQFNAEGLMLPDGLPARFVQCNLSGMLNWKDLGIAVLDSLGFPMRAQRTQGYIWNEVVQQAKLQGVIGIHFDECQHMFTATGKATNDKVLDGFKALSKGKSRHSPFALILSGVPVLASYVNPYTQLKELLNPVHFDMIGGQNDIEEMNSLCFAYADAAAINFETLATKDFYDRLAFTCGNRWGLVIELVIEALTLCKMDDRSEISISCFEMAFSERSGIPLGFSPFTVDDYRDSFSEAKLLELLTQDDA